MLFKFKKSRLPLIQRLYLIITVQVRFDIKDVLLGILDTNNISIPFHDKAIGNLYTHSHNSSSYSKPRFFQIVVHALVIMVQSLFFFSFAAQ